MATCNIDLTAFEATRGAVADDPSVGQGTFETRTEWVDGAQARTTARSFTIETDEPSALGGTDEAVDPMELLLAAVGTCLQIGWVTQAARRDIDLRSLRIDVSGDYDLRGYLALDDDVRPGFSSIRYSVEVDADATPEQLEEIRGAAEATSPMFDNARNGAPVTGSIAGPAPVPA